MAVSASRLPSELNGIRASDSARLREDGPPDERWRDKKAEAPSSIGPFFAAGDTAIYQSGDTPSLPSMSLTVTSVFEHDRGTTVSGRGPALPRAARTPA